jgi:O-antigen/teichoic acid export membrane protein
MAREGKTSSLPVPDLVVSADPPLAPAPPPEPQAVRGIARASALNLLARIISGAAALGLAILTTNVLDTDGRGIYAILGTWAGVLATIITGGTVVMAADLINGRQPQAVLHAAVSAIGLATAMLLLPASVLVSLATDWAPAAAFVCTAAVTALLSYSNFEMHLAQARGDVMRVSLTDIAMALFPLLVSVAAAVALDATVTTLMAAWTLGALITASAQFVSASPGALPTARRAWSVAVSTMRRSVGVAFANGVGLLCSRIDMLVVAVVLSTAEAGVYSIPVALAANLMLVSRALLTASYHSIMTAPASEVADRLSAAMRHSVILVLVAGGLSVPLVAAAAGFVFGDAYSDVWQPYSLLVAAIAFLCVAEFLRHFLLTRLERQRESVTVATGMLVLNGVLAIVGSAAFGLMGAAASTTIAYAAGTLVLIAICASELSVGMRALVMPRRADAATYWHVMRSVPGRLRRRRSR